MPSLPRLSDSWPVQVPGFFLSSDNGKSWSPINNGIEYTPIGSIAYAQGNIIASITGYYGYGFVITTDRGKQWHVLNPSWPFWYYNSLTAQGSSVCAGTLDGAYTSTDGGMNWSPCFRNEDPFSQARVGPIALVGPYVFAAMETGSVYRTKRPDSGAPRVIDPGIPSAFVLDQNYPNPFNGITTIRYGIPASSHVRLVVYDVLGRWVQTLVDEDEEPSVYETQLNSQTLASGVYFYRLIASGITQTRRMCLIK